MENFIFCAVIDISIKKILSYIREKFAKHWFSDPKMKVDDEEAPENDNCKIFYHFVFVCLFCLRVPCTC